MASILIKTRTNLSLVAVALTSTFLLGLALSGPARANAGGTASPTGAPATGTAKSAPAAKPHGIVISDARCVPASNCNTNSHEVSTKGRLLMTGSGLKSGMVVAFPRAPGAHIARSSPKAHLHNSTLGLVVVVPSSAHSGHIEVLLSSGAHSNAYGPIHVTKHRLHPPVKKPQPPPTAMSTTASGTAFDGQGMWIWYMSKSNGGSVASIVAQAKAANVSTLFIKSSDGSTNYWSQFSPQLVAELHANGLKACAWQYVYGTNPTGEANLGAEAVTNGADCLVIDAEAEYEGRYSAAQSYITQLRSKIGETYPVGLASFPYVDYHESFPYSVFMGPGGAQFNAPQMYWHDIGTSVENLFSHTYEENLIYGRSIMPLGQTYGGVNAHEIVAFRSLAGAYGAQGSSFWDWQETSATGWGALAEPLSPTFTVPSPELTSPLLKQGAKGDQVLWLQEHLASAIPTQTTSGIFDAGTTTNLAQFQTSHGIPASGETDASTWAALLALPPVAVDWTSAGPSGG